MKVILKVLMALIILILTLFVWLCSGILYCSAFIFGLAGTIVGLLGLAVLLTYSVQNGIILQEGKHYYVYMTAAANRFLRIYYDTVTAYLEKL